MKKPWYVSDRSRGLAPVRGPYRHQETAAAVRSELENRHPEREWNLWVTQITPEDFARDGAKPAHQEQRRE